MDSDLIARAVALGEHGRRSASPNPWVGCVIVDEQGAIAGEGWHRSPAPAPSPTPTPTLENRLGRIVVHASSREGYTLPAAQLQALGARTIADALRFIPGLVVHQSGTTGTLQTVQMRGASASQTLILLDGRPVNESDSGVTDFTSMPLDSVDRVVVIEGGLSSLYGSGAVGGVVEIFSRRPVFPNRQSAYVQGGYQGAFAGGIDAAAGGRNGGLRVDAATRSERNAFDYPSFNGIAGGTRVNNDLHAGDVSLCACFSFGRLAGADLHLDDNTSDVGAPGSTQFGPSFVSALARQQRDVNRASLNLQYAIGADVTTRLILYSDGRRVHFFDPTPSFPYDDLTLATQRGYSFQVLYHPDWHNVVAARYEGRGDVVLFQGTLNSPSQIVVRAAQTDAFIGDVYTGGDRGPQVDAGIRFAHTQGVASTSLPSIALKQLVGGGSEENGTFLRASYARAFRAPNLDERYFPGFGNPLLQPEYASTFDVGGATFGRTTQISATLFGSDTSNLIVNQAIDQLGNFLPFNVGRARVRGYSIQLSNVGGDRIGLQESYTGYPIARDLSSAPDINGVVTTGNRLLYRPTATASLLLWRRAGHQPRETRLNEDGIDVLFVGRQYGDEENKHLLPPYVTVGLHVSRTVAPGLALTLRADNLTSQRVPQFYGYPVMGTTFSLRLTAY